MPGSPRGAGRGGNGSSAWLRLAQPREADITRSREPEAMARYECPSMYFHFCGYRGDALLQSARCR